MNVIRDPAVLAEALAFHTWPSQAFFFAPAVLALVLVAALRLQQVGDSIRRGVPPAHFRARQPIIARWRSRLLALLGLEPAETRYLRLEFDSDAAMLVLRGTFPLLKRLSIIALIGAAQDPASCKAALRLTSRVERFMRRYDPSAQLRLARGSFRLRSHAGLRLTTEVKHLGDRVRVYAELRDGDARQTLFRLRYQGLPSEEDKILAEIVRRILAGITAQPWSDRSAPAGSTYPSARRLASAHPRRIDRRAR